MLLQTAAVLLALYAIVLVALWWGQERLLFQPQVLRADHRFVLDPDVHEHVAEAVCKAARDADA